MLSAFYVSIIYSSAHQTSFIHGANNMNPDQTAPKEHSEHSDQGSNCSQYWLPIRRREQATRHIWGEDIHKNDIVSSNLF